MFLYGQRGVQLFAAKPLVEVIWIRFRRMRKCAAAIWNRWSNPAASFSVFSSFFVKKNRTVCFFGLWCSKNLSAGDFQELHLTGRALRSLESHKVLLCTQQVVSIEAGSVGPCFYFGSWSGCWLFLTECFLLTFFVQTVVFPFVFFENTFRSLGRCLPVFCLYVYLLAAAFLWEWSGLAPESFIFSFDCSSFELSFHEPDHPVSRAGRHGDSAYAVVGAAKGLPSWHHGQKQRVLVESWFVLAISVSAI